MARARPKKIGKPHGRRRDAVPAPLRRGGRGPDRREDPARLVEELQTKTKAGADSQGRAIDEERPFPVDRRDVEGVGPRGDDDVDGDGDGNHEGDGDHDGDPSVTDRPARGLGRDRDVADRVADANGARGGEEAGAGDEGRPSPASTGRRRESDGDGDGDEDPAQHPFADGRDLGGGNESTQGRARAVNRRARRAFEQGGESADEAGALDVAARAGAGSIAVANGRRGRGRSAGGMSRVANDGGGGDGPSGGGPRARRSADVPPSLDGVLGQIQGIQQALAGSRGALNGILARLANIEASLARLKQNDGQLAHHADEMGPTALSFNGSP